jgi:hypothetical protein
MRLPEQRRTSLIDDEQQRGGRLHLRIGLVKEKR